MFGFKKELYTPEYQLAGDECAIIETSKGTIKVKFDGEGAPIHVANFCELSTMGFYDGLGGVSDRASAWHLADTLGPRYVRR